MYGPLGNIIYVVSNYQH